MSCCPYEAKVIKNGLSPRGLLSQSRQSLADEWEGMAWFVPLLFLSHQLVDIQPMDKGIKPAIARPIGIAESKTMSSVLIQV